MRRPPRHRAALLYASLLFAASPGALCPARAEVPGAAQPTLTPLRDVDVTYRVPGPRPLLQRMRFTAAAELMRVDPPASSLHMIIDYPAHTMLMVRDDLHAVLRMTGIAAGTPLSIGASPAAPLQRLGDGRVAGLPCTNWRTVDSAGIPVVVCVTTDGVLLQASRNGTVIVEAQSVAYGPQNPALFRVPPGYTRLTQPAP